MSKKKRTNTSESEDDISPYTTSALKLSIGSNGKQYTVLRGIIDRYPTISQRIIPLWPAPKEIALPEVHEDVGHTFVHYLYTGHYELWKPISDEPSKKVHDFRRSVLTYCAARACGMDGLAELAKANAECFGESISIFNIQDVAGAKSMFSTFAGINGKSILIVRSSTSSEAAFAESIQFPKRYPAS